jgi:hypothetical protein
MTIVGPHTKGVFAAAPATADRDPITLSVEALMDCARQCTARADSCLTQHSYPDVADCSAAALRCADICQATAWAVTRNTGNHTALNRAMLHACAKACRDTTDHCTNHVTRHQHHRTYDQACHLAEQACHDLLLLL